MMTMSRKALLLMALMLAAATAATAATAFAGTSQKLQKTNREVTQAIRVSADATQRAKVKAMGSHQLPGKMTQPRIRSRF